MNACEPVTVEALRKGGGAHKYSHGHALILSGPPARTGAARLAARAAIRIGAGLVTVGAAREALAECAAQLTAVTLREVGDGAALSAVLEDARINALCLGPGLGLDDRARGLVGVALGEGDGDPAPGSTRGPDTEGARFADRGPGSSPGRFVKDGRRPTVLDADALTLIARDPALFAALHPGCVLTPHHGEFGRLFPDIAEKLAEPATKGPAYSKVDATREAAARAGCVVLYKGPDTVIADPDGRCSINSAAYDRAAPWLATAGSGDVLAGFIAGLLARGFAPMKAAETAAWLHVECARSFGPGLIAEDIPEELPKVFRALGV
jgi:NAD(P)H-hydrate repair Nnr-like enzyme with NAD(P)H-hydrate dehydratase domain